MSSLLRLECKQKISSNAFRTRIFLHFRSYSSGIETTNTFIRLRSSLENHTRFQTKKKQKGKNTNLCCGIYLYGLYREVSHPTPPPSQAKITIMVQMCCFRLYSSIETASCRLLQQIARMDMVWNLKKLDNFFHAFNKCQQKKNTVEFSFVRYRLPNSAGAFQIYMRKGTKVCFKRRATAVPSSQVN